MTASNVIYTFGYGNRSNYNDLQKYFADYNINCLVDVRLKPYGWSKIWCAEYLDYFCKQQKVDYLSLKALGNTSGNVQWMPPDIVQAKEAIFAVKEKLEQGSVVLMCSEKDYRRCHRTAVADSVVELVSCPVVHLS